MTFPPRFISRLAIAASLTALAAALLSQHVGGLAPCPLCLLQRLPYAVIIFLGAAALLAAGRGHNPVVLFALIGALFALDAAIAFYHVGVEQGWFEGLAACAGGGETPDSVDALRALLLDEPAAPPCDRVQWSLFGISMAGYNMLYAALLAAITLVFGIKHDSQANGPKENSPKENSG